jgi:hypothetical protein
MVPSRTCAMLVLGFSLALAIVLSFPGELAFDGVVPAPTLRHSRAAHLPGPASIRPDPTTLGVGVEIESKPRSHPATSRLQKPATFGPCRWRTSSGSAPSFLERCHVRAQAPFCLPRTTPISSAFEFAGIVTFFPH